MSHPFGELLKQYRRRKPGLSQERLAHRIGYDEAVLVRMSQGRKDLTGPSGRDRVVRLIEILQEERALHTLDEANALLAAAQLPPLYDGIPIERALIRRLHPAVSPALPFALQSPTMYYTLPAPVSSFVGREQEITSITQELQSARLVTLTGAGGSGKTRLALEAGVKLAGTFTNGACFIGLATVRHADDVLPTIAQTLDVRESPDTTLIESVKRFLAHKSLLLVVDNFEHVLDSAPVLTEFLLAAPGVKALTTSRESLRLSGEQVIEIEPLNLHAAVQLFAQRARALKSGFRIYPEITPLIEAICQHMDCLPLAIEMAAARMRQFSPAALLRNLDERRTFSVLTDAPRDAPLRHRTLRDAIAWSYDLLSQHEQRALRALGVAVGGAEIEQIAHILAETPKLEASASFPFLLSHLQSLVNKNLVRAVEQPAGATRFLLHGLIREYALEQLQLRGELDAAQHAHAEAFLHLARDGMWEIRSHAQLYWHERIERDYPNFRAALAWSFDEAGSDLIGCQLVEALTYFWFIATRYLAETKAWTTKARAAKRLDMPPEVLGGVCTSVIINGHLWSFEEWVEAGRDALVHYSATQDARGIAIANYGLGAGLLGLNPHDEEGFRIINECLTLCRKSGNAWNESHALHVLGIHAMEIDDLALAERLHREMVEIRRRLGNVIDISIGLWQLAGVISRMGRFEEANTYLRECVALAHQMDSPQDVLIAECQLGNNLRAMGDAHGASRVLEACVALARNRLPTGDLIQPLILLGRAETERGDHSRAHELLSEAVQIMGSIGLLAYAHAYRDVLDAFAINAAARGAAELSARLWGAADVLWERTHRARPGNVVRESEPYRVMVIGTLGDVVYQLAINLGRAMSLEQAIDYALSKK